ncbi:MAG: hypothetical protein ACYTDU_17500 [Planctomycetota bacterium]|jgi:hypothetical protein
MKRFAPLVILAILVAAIGLALSVAPAPENELAPRATSTPDPSPPPVPAPSAPDKGEGLAAVERCAKADRYLFILFFNPEEEQTLAMQTAFEAATKTLANRAGAVQIDVGNPAEAGIVERFDAAYAPTPLVLALAPNGAVTGALSTTFKTEQLADAIVSPGMQTCLKAMQESKQVLLCFQNERTRSNQEALQGVHEYAGGPSCAETTEVVFVDPADPAEATLLERGKVPADADEAMTVLMTASGSFHGPLKGATTREMIVGLVNRACEDVCPPGG